MFSVIFDVQPKDAQRREEYLGHAKELKPELEQIESFIDNERFESRDHKGGYCRFRRGVMRRL